MVCLLRALIQRSFHFQNRLARARVAELIGQLQSKSFDEATLIQLANLIKFGFQPSVDAVPMVSRRHRAEHHRRFERSDGADRIVLEASPSDYRAALSRPCAVESGNRQTIEIYSQVRTFMADLLTKRSRSIEDVWHASSPFDYRHVSSNCSPMRRATHKLARPPRTR